MTATMTLEQMIRLPWSWMGPYEIEEGGARHWELRVAELPDFFVAAQSATEAKAEAADALKEFLRSYVENNEIPPMPAASKWTFYVNGERGWKATVAGITALSLEPREFTPR